MRAYREQDFDKMAERVVDRFMDGAKLADAATGEAQEGALNPDQIARLVHAANTQAFLRLMEQQKAQGGADMTHEFDPIDARQIIEQLVSQAPPPNFGADAGADPGAAPPAEDGPLPDELSAAGPGGGAPPPGGAEDGDDDGDDDDDNDGPFPRGAKDKAQAKAKAKAKDKDKPTAKTAAYATAADPLKEAAFRARRLRKFADVLEDQYRQAEWSFEDNMGKLSTCLRRAHGTPTMDAFEKDALALHGDDIGVAVLNIVRDDRGLPPLDFAAARTKAAALADRHIVEDAEAVTLFSQLVKLATDAAKLQRGAAHVRSLCA